MSRGNPSRYVKSTYHVFTNEFRRDILSSKGLIIAAIFVMFNLLMLLSFAYMTLADQDEDTRFPSAFQDPDSETWTNITISFSSAFYCSLLGLGAASYVGAGALARDMKSGALRLTQATPTSRESTYVGRNMAVFLTSYLLALLGFIVMSAGMIIVGAFAGLDWISTTEGVLGLTLQAQLLLLISIVVATTTTAALGTITKSSTIGTIGGIGFFLLIDSFLLIGASLLPDAWHLENLSFRLHQSEISTWLIGEFNTYYVKIGAGSFPLLSIVILLLIPIAAMIIGMSHYRKMDLD